MNRLRSVFFPHKSKIARLWLLVLTCILGLALTRPATAQTTLFQDEFNGTTISPTQWSFYTDSNTLQRTQFGNQPTLATENGTSFAHLKLDTYDPNANYTGDYLRGTEMYSKTVFKMGSGVELEARIRGKDLPRGVVFAFFLIGERGTYPSSYYKEEADFEFLSNQSHDAVWLNVWNDYNPRYNYNDDVHNYSTNPTAVGLDWSGWNVFKIRWLNDRVEWVVNDVVVRTDTAVLPDDPMSVHFNIWAPSSSWGTAYDASLPAATTASANTSYYADVDYIRVRSIAPPAGAVPGTGTGLTGTYFDNKDLIGNGIVSRIDSRIGFNWDNYYPDPSINVDTWSARWTGQVQAQYSETYTFYARANDGVRLWINGQQIINAWQDQSSAAETSATYTMVAGQKYAIKMEYYDNVGKAEVQLRWSSASTPKQYVPQSQLYPDVVSAPTFSPNGGSFQGSVVVTINDDTPSAIIHYTTNGHEPTSNDPSILPGSTLTLRATTTLKANAVKSGLTTSATTSALFTLADPTPPTVAITGPADGSSFSSLPPVTGTGGDTGGSGLARVTLQLSRYSDGDYWNGSTWSSTATPLAASGTTNWTFTLPALADGRYATRATATDGAGNATTSDAVSFWIDRVAPVVTITGPVNGHAYQRATLAGGTARDASSGIGSVSVELFRYADSTYWNGSAWVAGEIGRVPQGTTSWTLALPTLADGRYAVRAAARDLAGNASALQSVGFTLDTTPPVITISTPAIKTHYTSLSGAVGTAVDPGSGVAHVLGRLFRYADKTYWNGTAWTSKTTEFATQGTDSWTWAFPYLTGGQYYFMARALDGAGNLSSGKAVSFIFQRTPTITLTAPVNQTTYTSLAAASGTIVDNDAGVTQVRAYLLRYPDKSYWNGKAWTAAKTEVVATGIANWTWPFPALTNGSYVFRARALDRAGGSTETGASFTINAPSAAPRLTPPVTFSSASANAAGQAIELHFTGALANAADVTQFSIAINGVPVSLTAARVALDSITLSVPAGALNPGDKISTTWTALRDSTGRAVADGSWQGSVG